MNSERKSGRNVRYMVELALCIAIILIMAYTPLGYLHVAALEITFLMVPVTLGGILMGPGAGAILGGVFGLTSFAACFGSSPFGAVLLSIQPFLTFLVCVIPRILAGWIPGLLFHSLHTPQAGKFRKNFSFFLTALLGPVCNTLFFMLLLILCFYRTSYIQGFVTSLGATNPFLFACLFVGIQGLIEALVCCMITGITGRLLYQALSTK